MRITIFLTLLLSYVCVCATQTPLKTFESSMKTPLIIDTDAGWDDWIAISYLVKNQASSDYKIIGIVSNGVGEAHLNPGFKNIKNIVSLAGNPDIQVYAGSSKPLKYKNKFPENFRKSIDNLFGIKIPENEISSEKTDGVTFLKQTLQNSTHKVNILAIGGLTDLARVIKKNPKLVTNIGQLFIMGGVFDLSSKTKQDPKGNIKDFPPPSSYPTNNTAEWNIFIDPMAAEIVFKAVKDITIVPLNAAQNLPLTESFVNSFPAKTPLDRFISKVLKHNLNRAKLGGYNEYLYDPLSALIAGGKTSVSKFKKLPMYVEADYTTKDDYSGTTYLKSSGRPVTLAISANSKIFDDELVSVISRN